MASSSLPPPPIYTSKPIRILVINPNATQSMTDSCIQSILPTLPPDVEVIPFTGPANDAPLAIEGALDGVLSSAASCRELIQQKQKGKLQDVDAMLVACYSDHPLVKMLREEFHVPVIGIMEASLFYARTLGARFGIIATSGRSRVMHGDAVRAYGMEHFCAGVESCDLGVLDLERRRRDEIVAILRGVANKLVLQGAEVLTLGCAGMTLMKTFVEEAVREEGVQVVDGVLAGVHHLIGIVRIGGSTAKMGMWRSSEVARKERGQTYV